jgi:hypothetical protein
MHDAHTHTNTVLCSLCCPPPPRETHTATHTCTHTHPRPRTPACTHGHALMHAPTATPTRPCTNTHTHSCTCTPHKHSPSGTHRTLACSLWPPACPHCRCLKAFYVVHCCPPHPSPTPSPSDPLPPRAPKQYTHFSSQASNYSSGVGEGCVCQGHRSERDITQIWTLVRHPFAAASLQAVLCVGQG